MAETLSSSFEDDTESDSDKKKARKSSSARIAVPLPVERAAATPVEPENKPAKSSIQEAPAAFLDKIIGKSAEAQPTPQPERTNEPKRAEWVEDESPAPVAEALPQDSQAETVLEAEHNVAQDLADGAEISLQEIVQVPPDHDKRIVAEALDIATQAEQSPETEPEPVEEEPVIAASEVSSVAEAAAEAEPEQPQDSTVPHASQTPGIGAAYVQTPRTTLNPFRSRLFTPRNRPAVTPPSSPPLGGAYGPSLSPSGGSGGGNILPGAPNMPAPSNYNALPSTQQNPNIQRAIDDAEYEGRQRGRRQGLVAGLLVGGGIEHFRHKRREKKVAKQHTKEMQTQQKRVERLESDYAVAREEQRVERARAESKFTSLQLTQEAERKEREKQVAEAKRIAAKEQAAQQSRQEQTQLEEGLAIPKDHHVERSAWHNIEVDKSGRAVQESAFEYGHEYYKERAHEMSPAQQQQLDSAAGEVALVAAALSGSNGQSGSQTQSHQSQSSTVGSQGWDGQGSTPSNKGLLKAIATPPESPTATLVWLIILVIIFILIGLLAT